MTGGGTQRQHPKSVRGLGTCQAAADGNGYTTSERLLFRGPLRMYVVRGNEYVSDLGKLCIRATIGKSNVESAAKMELTMMAKCTKLRLRNGSLDVSIPEKSCHLVAIFSLCLILLLAACRSQGRPAPIPPPQQLTVSLLTNSIAPQGDEYLEDQILSWGAENGVEITFERAGFSAANPPDCGQIGTDALSELLLEERVADVSELVNRLDEMGGGFTEGALASVQREGKFWAIPYASTTYVFYVRQDKLDEQKLALPDTWAEAFSAAAAIHVPDEFWGWGMQLGDTGDTRASFRAQLWAYGGSLWDADGQPAIDSTATREVLAFYKAAWDAGLIPTEATQWAEDSNNVAYQKGQVGMVLNAGSILTHLLANDAELLEKTSVTLIPAGPAGRFIGGSFLQWGIFSESEQVSSCSSLTEWLFSPDQLRGYFQAASGTYLPTFPQLLADDLWQRPHLRDVVKMVPHTYAVGYPGPTTPWALEALQSDLVPKLIQRVLVDGWSTDEAVLEAHEALWQLYDRWQS